MQIDDLLNSPILAQLRRPNGWKDLADAGKDPVDLDALGYTENPSAFQGQLRIGSVRQSCIYSCPRNQIVSPSSEGASATQPHKQSFNIHVSSHARMYVWGLEKKQAVGIVSGASLLGVSDAMYGWQPIYSRFGHYYARMDDGARRSQPHR
jgi:hypothetical protein